MSDLRFSIIPGWIVTDPRLKGRDLQVLCLLGRHIDKAGWCFRSQVKMAKQLACARSTIQASLDRLMKIGVVERRAGDSFDGRDVSYHYRVVFDRDIAASTLAGWEHADADGGDDADRETGCRLAGTPADIPAPPADSGSAPPAGSGSAPYKNVPDLTPPVEPNEREAREGEREEGQQETPAAGERPSRQSLERRFWKLAKNHPQSAGMPKDGWLRAWLKLTPDEQDRAEARHSAWLALLKRQNKDHVPALSKYFAQKLFDEVEEADDKTPSALEARPFGKLWGAMRLKHLLAGPTAPRPPLTGYQRMLIERGQADEAQIRLEQQAKTGWPAINRMHELAAFGRGVTVTASPALEALSELMEQVRVGSGTWDAWQHEHGRRGWPWLPDMGKHDWVYFPRGGPAGLAEFEAAVRGEQISEAAE